LGNVSVSAENLLREDRVGETAVGEDAFDHRREQPHVIVGTLALLFIVRAVRDVALARRPHHKRARRLVERTDAHEDSAHIRMHDDRIGRFVGILHAGNRPALQTLLRVSRGILVGNLGQRKALYAHAQARFVHHYEHCVEAAVFFANEPAGGTVVVHHAGGVAVDAHLLFYRAAADGVTRTQRAVIFNEEFRNQEQRDAFGSRWRAVDAGEDKVNDIVRQIVFTGRYEYLG